METTQQNKAALRFWRGSLRPLRVDIVGDFAGKELFGIHGEALISQCLVQGNVDYEGAHVEIQFFSIF